MKKMTREQKVAAFYKEMFSNSLKDGFENPISIDFNEAGEDKEELKGIMTCFDSESTNEDSGDTITEIFHVTDNGCISIDSTTL